MTSSKTTSDHPQVWRLAFFGAVVLWISQPPLAIGILGWIALVPWGLLITREQQLGKRGWWILWSAAALYWLVTLQGVRLANPALYPGWFALAAFLGIYPMGAVGLSRVMHKGWGFPVWIALPSVWSGLELIRSYALTGLSAAMLGHTQAEFPYMIQIADIGGTYWVSFVVAMTSGWLAAAIQDVQRKGSNVQESSKGVYSKTTKVGGLITITVLASTFGYGYWRLEQGNKLAEAEPLLTVLQIQRNEPLEFTMNPSMESEVFQRYVQASIDAASQTPGADLVIWPESMFTGGLPYRLLGESPVIPEGVVDPDTGKEMSLEQFSKLIQLQGEYFQQRAGEIRRMMAASSSDGSAPEMLVGCAVYEYGETSDAYGGAVHINQESKVADWYGKMHLVMFGEYIPFGTYFPWLYDLGPLRQGATPGKGPVAMQIAGVSVAPSICFETMVEQATGNGLRKLRSQNQEVDLIANLTNDAWFHGTAILTHHRRCSQFVAVCNRRPLLMTANQGPTTWIDGCGRRIDSLPYEVDGILVAKPTPDRRECLYRQFGDLLSWPFAILCGILTVDHIRRKRASRKDSQLP